mmetsp:Transcript_9522/g.26791  ORF Transcript_9522/g.26791 Transcript_9522/m.26791 type:complete len:83 (+) Transcript_9522:274-522(+)
MPPELPAAREGTVLATMFGETDRMTWGLPGLLPYVFTMVVGECAAVTWDGELARVVERPRGKDASPGLMTVDPGLPVRGLCQ